MLRTAHIHIPMVSEHDSAQYMLWRRLVGKRRRIRSKIHSNDLKAGCLSVPAFLDLQVPKVFTLESEDPDWDPLRSGITSVVVCYFRVHERGRKRGICSDMTGF
jgi:hypothetical protein